MDAKDKQPSGPNASDGADDIADVVVLGAGVIGVASAYALARRGLNVVLADRNAGPGLGTSFANGGQLSYAYTDPLGNPALLRKLPSLVLGADPLFRIRPWLDPDLVRWGLRFLKSCSHTNQMQGTLDVLDLALESQAAMYELLARHPIEFGNVQAGKMHLYFDRDSLSAAEPIVAAKRARGAVQHVLSASEAIKVEPALRGAEGLVGGIYSPHDEVGDPYRFTQGLTNVIAEHYGVRLRFGFTAVGADIGVDEVRVAGAGGAIIRARQMVVALGVEAGRFLAKLGFKTPIQPLKGYSFTAPPGPEAPAVSITDTKRKLVFCNLLGTIRVAGGAELGVWNTKVTPARFAALVKAARASLPHAAQFEQLHSHWAGLRPMTPSSVPLIAQPRARLAVNVGHGMLGWTLAMGAAERLAKTMTNVRVPV